MKNLFKKIFISVVIVATMVGCGCLKKVKTDDITYGTSMLVSYTMNASMRQVDSICTADSLPSIDLWTVSQFIDYETNTSIVKRMYFKEFGKSEILYIITGTTEPYVVTRRITE